MTSHPQRVKLRPAQAVIRGHHHEARDQATPLPAATATAELGGNADAPTIIARDSTGAVLTERPCS